MVANGQPVLPCGITFVLLPAIDRILLIEFIHIVVTESLGKDAGRSNGFILSIAFDDTLIRQGLAAVALREDTLLSRLARFVGNGDIGIETVAVDDKLLGSHLQLVKRTMHRQKAGMKNIDLIDLLRRDNADSPRHGIVLNNLAELIALLGRELFRVVEQRIVVVTRQDDSGGIDTACQASAASLIAAGLYAISIIMWKQGEC